MKSLSKFQGSTLQWIQPRLSVRHHELVAGEDIFATLAWVKVLGSLAEASTADGDFTLKRGGFLRPFVSIRDAASGNDIAFLRIGMLHHGTMEFVNGRRISVLSTRFWGFGFEFVDENGQLLFTISKKAMTFKHSATVTIEKLVRRDRDLVVMLVAGWYAIVLMSEEAAAVAASAGAS